MKGKILTGMENSYIISVGTNLGNKEEIIDSALTSVEKLGTVRRSNTYSTPPLGFDSDLPFFNLAIELVTPLAPIDCLDALQQIEVEHDRVRSKSGEYIDRSLDLDIIYIGNQIINEDRLIVPHPKRGERLFVLVPINDLIPNFRDPIFDKAIPELIAVCQDKSLISLV